MAAVPDLDLARIRKFCEERTPAEYRGEMRVEADVRGRSVIAADPMCIFWG